MMASDTDTRPFNNPLRRKENFDVKAHRAIIERDELEVENAALAASNARLQHAVELLERRVEYLGNGYQAHHLALHSIREGMLDVGSDLVTRILAMAGRDEADGE